MINGRDYDVDEMNPEQRKYLATQLKIQILNAAYRGQAIFFSRGLRSLNEVFPPV